ncbi:hypothetical protein P378_14570 [Desulforamulus profundi]|uniref:Uncharacterized protein n=1 Tax=Desulforamulus profundi TaxID=1383067 RepID=A0A2C6L227_9FIRM|nr:hypothetical protein [Desulforamulus profundi]PHJ37711.1 hypothetical protein P378_14570 [Desulforamulus profundi]
MKDFFAALFGLIYLLGAIVYGLVIFIVSLGSGLFWLTIGGIFAYLMAGLLHSLIGGPVWLWLSIFIICIIYMVMDAFMGNKYDVWQRRGSRFFFCPLTDGMSIKEDFPHSFTKFFGNRQ